MELRGRGALGLWLLSEDPTDSHAGVGMGRREGYAIRSPPPTPADLIPV